MTLIWAADFSAANNSYQAGFTNVQYQADGGSIVNNYTAIPSNTGPTLGRSLYINLATADRRLEATPPDAWNAFTEGMDRYFRFDFVLGSSFKLNTTNWWNCVNQIHDAGTSSPPIEFDVESGRLSVRGASGASFNTYHLPLTTVAIGAKYSVIYRVKFSATAASCLLEVWVNGSKVLNGYVPPTPNLLGGASYWKGATLYRDAAIGAEDVYETNLAVATTYADLAGLNNGNSVPAAYAAVTPPAAGAGTLLTLGDGKLLPAHLTDFWSKLTTWLVSDANRAATVVALGLMNEPHDLPGGASTWEQASQSAVNAIRSAASGATSAPSGSAVPAKFIGGYLANWSTLLPRSIPSTYNLIFLAFATIDSSGAAVFTPAQNVANLKTDIAARTAAGKATILSVGGGNGAAVGLTTTAQQDAFFSSVISIIDAYGFTGVDWDLETGIPGGISVTGMASLSRRLVARYGSRFAITMAPFGSTATTYKQLATSIQDVLTFVGYQFYNDNQIPTASFVLNTMNDWMATCGLREDQFSLGFMHVDDYLSLTTPYTTMSSIYSSVNSAHPGVRGAWCWEISSQDQPAGYPFASTMAGVIST